MTRAPRRTTQAGFTLVELLIGVILGTIFMFAIYGFYDSSLQSEMGHEAQATAQGQARDAMNQLTSQLREAVSPDNGVTPPVVTLTPTQITFYADLSRDPMEQNPKPQEFSYQITGGVLTRQIAQPIGASPPYSYSAFSGAESLVSGLTNSASAPMFSAVNGNGNALPASMSSPTTMGIELIHVNINTTYKIGNSTVPFTLSSDVVPINPTSGNN